MAPTAMTNSTGFPTLARPVILWGLAGAASGAGLGAWLRGVDRIVLGAVAGLTVGALCGTVDSWLSQALAWAVRQTPNRVLAGIGGAVIATATTVGMTLLILGAVGWVGSCWG